MSMSKKDYIAVAAEIKAVADESLETRKVLARLVKRLCYVYQQDSPLFRRTTFIEACGFRLQEVQ